MTTEILVRESAELIHGDGRTVVVQLAKWGEPRTVSDDGTTTYREAFESFELADRVRVVDQHFGETIGHADIASYRAEPEPTIDLHIAETARGDDVLALVRNGTIEGVSVEFRPSAADRLVDGVMRRANALVQGIAFAFRPAHSAPILATREQTHHQETDIMSTDETPAGISDTDLAQFGDELRRDMLEQFNQISSRSETPDPYAELRKYRSLAEFALARYDDPDADSRILTRALVDQTTPDNPGVIPPAWVQEVKGIVDFGRPTISAFGVTPLDPNGMELNWPYFDGDFSALVGEQLTEKSEITSVSVPIKKGTSPLKSYAGGSDLSLQLVRRSSPSYVDSYSRIMSIGYAAATDAAALAVAIAAAASGPDWDPSGGTSTELLAALFGASTQVEAATGAPASFAICATDVYNAIGTLSGGVSGLPVAPAPYGTQNVAGTADAASLRINVSGLPIIHDQYAPAGTFLVSNGVAGSWHEDGPMTLQENNVAQLGVDWAIWGMGAFSTYTPAGVVAITPAAP